MSLRRKAFDVLPALSVRGQPLRSALRTVTVAWMFGVVWMSCISGSQMIVLGNLLNFSNRDFGLLSSIGFAAYFSQLLSAVLVERTGLRKYHFILFATIHRMLWLVIGAVPLMLWPGRPAVITFMVIYAVAAVLAHMSMPPWQNWMGDLIPRRIRGRYFANRRLWTVPVQVLTVAAAGVVLDLATRPGEEMTVAAQPTLVRTLSGLFAVGAVFGTIDVLLFLRMREIVSPPLTDHAPPQRRGLPAALGSAAAEVVRIFLQALPDRAFLHVGLYGAAIGFAMAVGGPFYVRNSLDNLQYSKFGSNLVFMICGPLVTLLMVRLWGRLIDRWGRRPVLILATIGVVFSPAGWFLIPAHASTPGWIARLAAEQPWLAELFGRASWQAYALGAGTCIFGAIMWSGIELARFNVLLGFSETGGRSKYIAAAAVFMAAGGSLGGLAGGVLADTFAGLQQNPLHVGPFLWNNWHLTFLASSAARAAAILCLIGMPDPGARPFRAMIRHFRFNAYSTVLPRLFWPLRAMGQFRAQRRAAREAKRNGKD